VQIGRNPQFPETTGARIYLVMLQLLFVAILVEPLLRTLPFTQPQGILLGVLAVLMVAQRYRTRCNMRRLSNHGSCASFFY
jgi:hypothetical protein